MRPLQLNSKRLRIHELQETAPQFAVVSRSSPVSPAPPTPHLHRPPILRRSLFLPQTPTFQRPPTLQPTNLHNTPEQLSATALSRAPAHAAGHLGIIASCVPPLARSRHSPRLAEPLTSRIRAFASVPT
eukprot:scaffold80909_cov62-Phaeocystis_antarctica.AAC.9